MPAESPMASRHSAQRLDVRVVEEGPLPLVRPIAVYSAGRIEGPVGAQIVGVHQGAVANAAQEIRLARFERDQATEDVEHVHQLRGVLGEPAVGLDPFERGRRAPVADDGPGAVAAAVAEPLDEHLLARYFVLPHRGRHVVDEAVADLQATGGGIVVDAVGESGPGGSGSRRPSG